MARHIVRAVRLASLGDSINTSLPFGEPVVVKRRRVGPPFHGRVVAHTIDVIRRCPDLDRLPSQVQNLSAGRKINRSGKRAAGKIQC